MDRIDANDFLKTIRDYLTVEGLKGILDTLEGAEISLRYYDTSWDPFNKDITVVIECSIVNFKKITTFKNSLSKICSKLLANSDYAFKDLLITPKLKKEGTPDQVKEVNSQQAYSSLLVLAGELLDPIESAYIIEACNSAKAGMNLAAATMLGCAAEQLLKNLSDSYHTYLKNSGDSVKDYESKVIKSKTSYMRLTNFYNYVTSNKKTFEKHGLQNPGASYAVLEIIRQTRNESGHPTGIIISDSNMHELFSLYNVWLPRFHKLMASFNESIVETKN